MTADERTYQMGEGDDEDSEHAEGNSGLKAKDDHCKLYSEECVNQGVHDLCTKKGKKCC